jgi:hypothetical protein
MPDFRHFRYIPKAIANYFDPIIWTIYDSQLYMTISKALANYFSPIVWNIPNNYIIHSLIHSLIW